MADLSTAVQKLIEENALLKQRILDLEQSDAKHRQAGEAPREDNYDKLLNAMESGFACHELVTDPNGTPVEDEPAILSLTTTMLERQGYTVLAAHTPGEAIRLAREHTGEIHLLITDVVMPELNGGDLARNVLSVYPHMARLFMSGYPADVIAHRGVLDEGVHFVQKPFSIQDLAAKVREALNREAPAERAATAGSVRPAVSENGSPQGTLVPR